MTTPRIQVSPPRLGVPMLLLALGLACVSAFADSKADMAAARARYQQERLACASGPASQDRAACLREASAAFAETKQAAKDDQAGALAHNASKRCEALPDADRLACLARMRGQGSTSGSVANGGIYRELVTTDPAQASPDRPASGALVVPAR